MRRCCGSIGCVGVNYAHVQANTQRITELLGHGPGCRCRLHQAAAQVRVQQVYRSVAALQRDVGKTRILAAR
jgi:hypothetical protein